MMMDEKKREGRMGGGGRECEGEKIKKYFII